jgi:hypothetical protein
MMTRSMLAILVGAAVALLGGGIASAGPLVSMANLRSSPSASDPTTNEPFPTAGDAYCSATNGCGTIPSGGQTGFQWTTGDYVTSSIFTLPTNSVTDLTANWSYTDYLNGSTELWYVYVNGVAVGMTTLVDCGCSGATETVTDTINFPDIAPVSGGYQVELVLQNTVPPGNGSVAWQDGGITGLSYSAVPEPVSISVLGAGLVGLGVARRRRKS